MGVVAVLVGDFVVRMESSACPGHTTNRGAVGWFQLSRIHSEYSRIIFHVADVDGFWAYFKEKCLHPESPRDASWGERYFQMCDPHGHELSFAQPI